MHTSSTSLLLGSVLALGLIGCGDSSNELELPPELDPPAESTGYFLDTYDEARTRFRGAAQALQAVLPEAEIGQIPVPSETDADLTMDWLYVPATGAPEKLLIVTSGVHGIEAFAGSAVQHMMLSEMVFDQDRTNLSLLFVHAVNPWGYRHLRRVNENNIDMNRSFAATDALFARDNANYPDVDPYLNRTTPVSMSDFDERASYVALFTIEYSNAHPDVDVYEAMLSGQWAFPAGLYYGGAAFEAQKATLEELLVEKLELHSAVFLMDLHTGFGDVAELHLFGAPDLGTQTAVDAVFAGYEIDTGDSPDFYPTYGDFILYLGELAQARDMTYVGMTMEYGTLGLGLEPGADSLGRTLLENQGHHHGYENAEAQAAVEDAFRELYYPSDPTWRTTIMSKTQDMLPVFIERFIALP